ncbi:ABC transporter ATP-binding protein [Luteimonas sp BLCC-B24]|uniref:ABC transporter ATP-binding protein n=1 Tax=Luteimonas sp. BLCC-B24 TaxID=3025317 RepID=UPI00234C8349|nr:ABC transporter ATP-binding protein [Luteimonas sp. BLCC-B24]MDC7807936.1 ABC transporter ATP-binding protein [Luteimonas sp. BLCC-B24]
MSFEPAISISGVSKCFEMYNSPRDRLRQFFAPRGRKYYREFWALRDISFDVMPGETIGILGRNGGGKSTLLQIIAGTLTPTHGEVRVNGLLAALLELGSGFNAEFTGRENVFLNGAVLGFSQAQMKEKFAEIEAFADIGEHMDQPVRTYSSGMYVRLAFAVQACVDPQVLIVDEALSVGDEKFQRKCYEYIEGLRARGCAIIIVTHATSTVEKFCQRAVLLHKGQLHGIGDANAIIDQYHALLYSDEKAYLRYLNAEVSSDNAAIESVVVDTTTVDAGSETDAPELAVESLAASGEPDGDVTDNAGSALEEKEAGSGLRAYIESWSAEDIHGERCEAFMVGDSAVISARVRVLGDIDEMQFGILLRTVEGVSAFGSSTMYHDANVRPVVTGGTYEVRFKIDLSLCEGTYFVTLALAEAISHADMAYLDRKTDIIILKVRAPRAKGTGIAALPVSVAFTQLR